MTRHPEIGRRGFLAGAAPLLLAAGIDQGVPSPPRPLPPRALLADDPDRWWSRVRDDQFLLDQDFVYLNNGTLGVPPRVVLEAVGRGLVEAAQVGLGPINRWGAPIEGVNARPFTEIRSNLARRFHCRLDEITLTHNATEALAMIAGAVALERGDEVLITNQEHPANRLCWTRAARETGAVVVQADLPRTPRDTRSLLEAFERRISPRTKLLAFPGIITATGIRLPIQDIVELGKAHDLLTVVDGAHLPGQVPLDLEVLGCDYLAASPHKWMFAPAGCGFLYGRGDGLARLAGRIRPEIEPDDPGQALMQTGTNSGAIFDGFSAAIDFYDRLGPQEIFARLRALRDLMLDRARRIPGLQLYTPEDPAYSAGMISFHFADRDLRKIAPRLEASKIRCAVGNGARLSAHVHTRPADIDRFFAVLSQAMEGA